MNKILKIIILVFILLVFSNKEIKGEDSLFNGQEWYDLIETVEVNRELAHAYFIPYQDEETALSNEKSIFTKSIYNSDYIYSLNGEWKLKYVSSPYEQLSWNDEEHWETDDWDDILIPSNIQLQFDQYGFKYDKPIYINMLYPWTNYEEVKLSEYPKAPLIGNSVTHFKKNFTIDKEWNNRQVFVNFDGIGSAFYLFINGNKVGYSEDSYTTHQFNITSFLNTDEYGNISNVENTIAIQLYRFSTGSYLENQDMIRLNGIFRDIYLISKSDVEIRDIFIKTSSDKKTTLDLEASVRNLSNLYGGNYKIKAYLYDENDNPLWNSPLLINYKINSLEKNNLLLSKEEGIKNNNTKEIINPIFWSDENPYLYRLLINLYDDNDNIIETTCLRFGIRDINIQTLSNKKQQIVINDKPILIKGVNRHEIDSIKGSALSKEDIINDLITIKQNNINAIRTSHYPNNVITYEIADEIGIYIMDEANIESHYGAVSDDIPSGYIAWNNSVIDRVKNMVERDKNYTSIIMWSLGNESTYKEYSLNEEYSMHNASKWILDKDPTRLRTYERDNRSGSSREESMVDVYSSQYFSTTEIIKYLNGNNKLPYIQSEYAHSMGNAMGNLKEYWDIFRQYKNAQGGFIWDYKDQAILLPTSLNKTSLYKNDYEINEYFYAYGGDFGEIISDLEFSGNGIVFADNTLSPKIYEVKKVYQSINFKMIDKEKGIFNIDNEFLFTNLNSFNITYKLINDGIILKEEKIENNLEPLSNKNITIPFDFNKINNGFSSSIIFEISLKKDTNYGLKKDDIIAYEQFELYKADQLNMNSNDTFKTVNEDEKILEIEGSSTFGKFNILFDKENGMFKYYKLDNTLIFENGPYLNYFRSPISNDSQYSFNQNEDSKYSVLLENTQEAFLINNITIQNNKTNINIIIKGKLNVSNDAIEIRYIIYSNGIISVYNTFYPTKRLNGVIPKIGMELILDDKYSSVTYFGKGPYENYPDRNSASIKDIYEDNVKNMFTKMYLRPQDNGYRTNVDFIKLYSEDNLGILITGNNLQVNALAYNYKQINNSDHFYELPNSDYIYLNINGNTRGLGNAICGDLPLSKYVINLNKEYSYQYRIIPFNEVLTNNDMFNYALYK